VAGVPKTIDNDIAVIICTIYLFLYAKAFSHPINMAAHMMMGPDNILILRLSTSPLVLIRLWKRPSVPLIQLMWKLAAQRME
jgi:hypothetical protein